MVKEHTVCQGRDLLSIQHLWGKSYYSLIFTTRIIYISSLYLMALAIILVQVQTQPLALSLRMRVVALEPHLTAI
jgi:hypothetical protein